MFPCFWVPNTHFSGALRAPKCFIFLCFPAFGLQIIDFSGALRAPKCLVFLCFPCFWAPNTKEIPARFARRNASFPFVSPCSWAPNTIFFPARFARRKARHGPGRSRPGWAGPGQEFFFIVHSEFFSSPEDSGNSAESFFL